MFGIVYGRTSRETDDAFSVSSQIDATTFYARENNIVIPPEYIFREDHTGKALDRPEYNKVRELIRAGRVSALIIYATDRLARKVSIGEIFLDELFQYNVQLHIVAWGTYVKDTPEDRLRFNVETTFSSFEWAKIVERTSRGRMKKATLGGLVGNMRPLYGYTLNEYKNGYELAETAPIAGEVLVAYGVDHASSTRIADMLQSRGVKTPGRLHYEHLMALYERKLKGGLYTKEEYEQKIKVAKRQLGQDRWLMSQIYVIVRNHKAYAGDYTFTVAGKTFHLPIPPIISEEESEAVARQLLVGKRRLARSPVQGDYLMTRRLTCDMCKHSYVVAPKRREERETLSRKLTETTVDPAFIQSFEEMGKAYRTTLETSEDFSFWRGLVDDLDLTANIGIDKEQRRYIDFVVFGKVRKREYLDDSGGDNGGFGGPDAEGGPGDIDFSRIKPGLYAAELGGFRHSDTALITEDGMELLTYYPRDLESLTIPA